jgi:hypothetical protein
VTVTLIVQVPLAAMVPPEREMVLGEVLVSVPVVQAVVVPDVTVKPSGRISVNETPVKDVVALGFASVNVSVLVLPVPIVVGEKLLERLGTVGMGQPLKVMLSRPTEAPLSLAPLNIIRNVVVPVPVDEAVYVVEVFHPPFVAL